MPKVYIALGSLLNLRENDVKPTFYSEVKKISDAIDTTNDWLKSRSKYGIFFIFKKISYDVLYGDVHWRIDKMGILIRDKETNVPIALRNSFIQEVADTLKKMDIDLDNTETTNAVIVASPNA